MIVIERRSQIADPAAAAAWLAEFVSCAAAIRATMADSAPGAEYSGLIAHLAAQRPFELILARDDRRIVGRALVATAIGTPNTAVIGLFEANDDAGKGPASAVITACEDWARTRGVRQIFAPVDLNTWFTYRFLVGSPQKGAPPLYAWEPAQPSWYIGQFSEQGYLKDEHYETIGGELDPTHGYGPADAVRATQSGLETALAAGFTFERLEKADHLAPMLEEMHPVCMAAFKDNLLFEPLPLSMFSALYLRTAAKYDCSLSHWVRDNSGALVGFVLVLIDDGAVVVKTIAVAGSYRGQRLSTALTHLVLKHAAERGFTRFVSALVRSGNTSGFLSQAHLGPGVTPWKREYVLLRRDLSGS